MANDLVVGNTCFLKRESHLITYSSGGCKSQIDYILYRKSFRKLVCNVKVIPGEECLLQHHLLVCDFKVSVPKIKKRKFNPRLCVWKLRDANFANEFQAAFNAKPEIPQMDADKLTNVEDIWHKLKTST